MINGPQCRAARALIDFSRERLAISAGVSIESILRFESKLAEPTVEEVSALQAALEQAGAVFISDNGRGIGVRLKFTRSEAKRIAILENEGGIVAPDRVP
ncbi:XRE family transcriptional regulator (plasmid) [Rhizobium leguminosarum]|uniref:helix-turn-helix domain-containing protein n=1 Tax=Rhizobium leguminosarum TaxID=384 RepID=UPI00102F32AC|nr:XRE family transcriptional regulator [Rhizobium leguminosarum]NKK93911.1 XRE family transcriptional regulator [Rhizobium leguminosarum bv. viciae]TAU86582.1 XRE family transcriptional regulator [Rhizobium leguminosarum]TAU99404.1 XRE family transcriptional regulator [Rhizobium leguminosarum]TAW41442.1 XRE family transcriptional regulator [Rhizobium leguminosarum]TAY26746.1 XRE family transcriptional regulator [Rhizobium leguminosarum]